MTPCHREPERRRLRAASGSWSTGPDSAAVVLGAADPMTQETR